MLNINAFQIVVHEKNVLEVLSKFSLFCPLLGPAPLFEQTESPSPKHISYQVWLRLVQWFLRRCLKESLS